MDARARIDPVVICLIALAIAPFGLAHLVGAGAILRYCTSMALAPASILAGVAVVSVHVWLVRRLAAGVSRNTAAVAFFASAVGVLMTYVLLWKPELSGMATVGGGDAGHHIWITNQLAYDHPRVYQGFTTFHAATWVLSHLFGGPFGGVRAAFFLSTAGFLCGGVAVALLAARAAQRQTLVATLSMIVLMGTWYRLHLLWAHYNQADGFFAHLHGAITVEALLIATAVASDWRQRAFGLLLAVVGFRFTYALNAGDVLLVCAAVVAPGAWQARHDQPRLSKVIVGGAAVACVAALVAYVILAPKFPKPGGIMAPHAGMNALALAAGGLGCWLFRRSEMADINRPLRHLATFAALLGIAPLLVIVVFALFPSLPRAYYFHKYPLTALVALSTVAPPLAAFAIARLGGELRKRRNSRNVVVMSVVLACCAIHARAADKASAPLRHSFLERTGKVTPMRQSQRLHDPLVEALARRQMSEANASAAVFLHPSWPVFNFTDNVLNAWRPAPKRPVKGLQDQRWRLFLDGRPPRQSECLFWSDGAEARRSFEALVGRNPGAKVGVLLQRMRANPQHRCRRIGSGTDSLLCWVCR